MAVRRLEETTRRVEEIEQRRESSRPMSRLEYLDMLAKREREELLHNMPLYPKLSKRYYSPQSRKSRKSRKHRSI